MSDQSDYYELTTEVDVPKPISFTTSRGEIVIIAPPSRRQIRDIRGAQTSEEADRAMFGENYDLVTAHFDELPVQYWDAFLDKMNAHFFGPGADQLPGKSPA